MAVTVRYPLDFTCSLPFGCINPGPTYPIVGYAPTFIHAHLDSPTPAPYLIGISLEAVGGTSPGSEFISARIEAGTTDGTGVGSLVIPSDTDGVQVVWTFNHVSESSSIHYVGWADITYGDVEPPIVTIRSQLATIVG